MKKLLISTDRDISKKNDPVWCSDVFAKVEHLIIDNSTLILRCNRMDDMIPEVKKIELLNGGTLTLTERDM